MVTKKAKVRIVSGNLEFFASPVAETDRDYAPDLFDIHPDKDGFYYKQVDPNNFQFTKEELRLMKDVETSDRIEFRYGHYSVEPLRRTGKDFSSYVNVPLEGK